MVIISYSPVSIKGQQILITLVERNFSFSCFWQISASYVFFAKKAKTESGDSWGISKLYVAPKQISHIGVEATGRHVKVRVELKYTCLGLREKSVIPSLSFLNSKKDINYGIWLQLKITTNQPVTWTTTAKEEIWS